MPQDEYEDDADRPPRVRGRSPRRPPDPVEKLIPYRNPTALAAYYCGVFGLIPCVGLILGPVALIFGLLGIRHAGANPRAHGKGHAIAGIVLGSLEILGNYGVIIVLVIAGIMGRR